MRERVFLLRRTRPAVVLGGFAAFYRRCDLGRGRCAGRARLRCHCPCRTWRSVPASVCLGRCCALVVAGAVANVLTCPQRSTSALTSYQCGHGPVVLDALAVAGVLALFVKFV